MEAAIDLTKQMNARKAAGGPRVRSTSLTASHVLHVADGFADLPDLQGVVGAWP